MLVFKQSIDADLWLEARCETLEQEVIENAKGLAREARFSIFMMSSHSEFLIGKTSLSPMPGCCGIVVSHYTELTPNNRGTSLSDPFRDLKSNLAKALGYTVMVATTDMSNFPAVGNMFKSKYKMVSSFINKRTNHLIGIGIKTL